MRARCLSPKCGLETRLIGLSVYYSAGQPDTPPVSKHVASVALLLFEQAGEALDLRFQFGDAAP
jgi:hypothetical protein